MKTIKELEQSERNALKKKHKSHELFETHIELVLNQSYCYRLDIFASDYNDIIIRSCRSQSPSYPHESVSEAIAGIKNDQSFFENSYRGCLRGVRVQHYRDKLSACQLRLQDCFVKMGTGDCFMLDRDGHEIMDGMHRLVAYGLVTNLNEKHFPIPIYFGTDILQSRKQISQK